jgi:hypothetical protein
MKKEDPHLHQLHRRLPGDEKMQNGIVPRCSILQKFEALAHWSLDKLLVSWVAQYASWQHPNHYSRFYHHFFAHQHP